MVEPCYKVIKDFIPDMFGAFPSHHEAVFFANVYNNLCRTATCILIFFTGGRYCSFGCTVVQVKMTEYN